MSKGHVQAYLESSKARRKRRNTLLAVFASLVVVLSLVGLVIFLVANRPDDTYRGVSAPRVPESVPKSAPVVKPSADTSQSVPDPKVLESVLKSALGKPAHGMAFQEFKSKLYSMKPLLVKGVGVSENKIPEGYDLYLVGVTSVWLPRDQVDASPGGVKTDVHARVVDGIQSQSGRIVRVEIKNGTKTVVGFGEAPKRVSMAEAYDHFSVSKQSEITTFVVEDYALEDDAEKGASGQVFSYLGSNPSDPQDQPVFPVPRSGAYGYKADFLSTFGEPDRMATAGQYLNFEYNLRAGKVVLSVLASYWDMGVFWVRSLNYEGAYND